MKKLIDRLHILLYLFLSREDDHDIIGLGLGMGSGLGFRDRVSPLSPTTKRIIYYFNLQFKYMIFMDSLDHRATWKRVDSITCGDRNSYWSTWEFEFAGIYQRLLTSKKCRDIRPFKPRCEPVREDLAVSSAQQYDYAFACSGAKCASKGKPVLIAIHQVDGSAKQEWQFTENRVLINLSIIIFIGSDMFYNGLTYPSRA